MWEREEGEITISRHECSLPITPQGCQEVLDVAHKGICSLQL